MKFPRNQIPKIQSLGLASLFLGMGDPASAVVINDSGNLADAAGLATAYDGIGWVEIQEGASSFRGTGILIGEEWVLTAAHNWLANDVTGLTFHLGGSSYSAQQNAWYQHPGWEANPGVNYNQGWDVGLFRLSNPVTGGSLVNLYSGSAELGSEITVIGAGSAGTSATGPTPNPTPNLYGFTNVIDRVVVTSGANLMDGGLLAVDFDDGSVTRNTLFGTTIYDTFGGPVSSASGLSILGQSSTAGLSLLEGTSAAGDSGGPAFADFGNGPELVGLVSWGVNPSQPTNPYGSGSGDVSYLTRISAVDDWIYATIPEPGTGMMMLICVSFSWVRRRTPNKPWKSQVTSSLAEERHPICGNFVSGYDGGS